MKRKNEELQLSDYQKYIEKLEKLQERQQAIFEAAEGQSVILFHEAFY